MTLKYYGNCVVSQVPCLITAELNTRLFQVSGTVSLRSKKDYFEELVGIGLIRESDISPDFFPDLNLELNQIVRFSGEMSENPEQGFFLSFYSEGSVSPYYFGLTPPRGLTSIKLTKFLWKNDEIGIGATRIRCPFCGDYIESRTAELLISWDTAFDPKADLGHVKECPGCKAFVTVSSDRPADIFRVLINYAERLYTDGAGFYLRKEEISKYHKSYYTKRVLLTKLTVFDPLDRSPSTLFYLYGIRRI